MSKRGFTIIEILVVLFIMGLILVTGTVRFRDYQRRQVVTGVKREMLSDVRAAQSDAANGRKPNGCQSMYIQGYSFEVASGGGSYEIVAICVDNGISHEFPIKEVIMPQGTQLSFPVAASSTNPVIFKPLAQGTNIPSNRQTVVRIGSGSTAPTLTVTAGGDIR